MEPAVVCEGWLVKAPPIGGIDDRTGFKSWKRRYCRLTDDGIFRSARPAPSCAAP